MQHPVLTALAEKHGVSPAQVLIRWSLQMGFVPLPKSVHAERIRTNADVFHFELDAEDMSVLEALDEGAKGSVSWNPVDRP
jgi:diketogulonate reductase-like aldo/keto reductase